MPAPLTPQSQQKTPRVSRPAAPLRVAQIYGVKWAKAYPSGDAAVAVLIGDAACTPHVHGLRAARAEWVEIITGLLQADPFLAERVRARLA